MVEDLGGEAIAGENKVKVEKTLSGGNRDKNEAF